MKKHIISNYLEKITDIGLRNTDDSTITETIEMSDPDEFSLIPAL